MATSNDLFEAKQSVSDRLLRAGLRGRVVGARRTHSVALAIGAAGHNVHAVGIGRKLVDGKATAQRCVRFYVVHKLPASLLPPRDRLPETIAGVPTDVIESPPAFVLVKTGRKTARKGAAAATACTVERQKRQRPLVAGISAAHVDVTAGTISCFCRSVHHGDDPSGVFVLSNNHVFADTNHAQGGDGLYQPGPVDGGTLEDHFAALYRFVPLHLDGTTPNRVDAAIGKLLEGVSHRTEVCGVGRVTGAEAAVEDMKVRKHGRTTGYTEGMVTDTSYDVLVGMDDYDTSVVGLFENQYRVEVVAPHRHFGLGGDSGSLVCDRSRRIAVGLYFAGPESGVYGIANPIQDVLNELKIELI